MKERSRAWLWLWILMVWSIAAVANYRAQSAAKRIDVLEWEVRMLKLK